MEWVSEGVEELRREGVAGRLAVERCGGGEMLTQRRRVVRGEIYDKITFIVDARLNKC